MLLCPGMRDDFLQSQPEIEHEQWFREILFEGQQMHSVIRSKKCLQISPVGSLMESPCTACKDVKLLLLKRIRQTPSVIHPKAPLSKMSKQLLADEILELRRKQKELVTINKKIVTESIRVSSQLHEELLQFYNKATDHKEQMEPFVRLFWEEQEKAFQQKKRGMRWHPMLIKFAIMIRQQSPALYRTLRDVGVLRLPGESTLRDYTTLIGTSPGFQQHALQSLSEKATQLADHDKFVVLMHDEMRIKQDLVFNRKSDELVGYVAPEQFDPNQSFGKNLAQEVLLFLVVGLTSDIHCSVAYFGVNSAKASSLFKLMWDAIFYIEISCGLKVIASTSDKASCNMKLYQMHGDGSELVYKTENLYASTPRCVFFISDVPHLLKTFRNNIYNSRNRHGKRLLKVGDQVLTWNMLIELWESDIKGPLYKTKLTYDHIYLTPQSMMKVRLAAQVLSESVGKILQEYGRQEVQELAKVLLLIDKFFDAFNVRSHTEATRKLKPFCRPYSSVDDERFEWLEKTFLQYFFDWQQKVKETPKLKASEKAKMFISAVTFKGLVMTVRSITEATKFVLNSGVKFVYTNRFCQDPVEEVFGRHRAMGRRSDNMNLHAFGMQERALHLQGQLQRQFQPGGNVTKRKTKEPICVSNQPLAKLKRTRIVHPIPVKEIQEMPIYSSAGD